MAHLQNQNRLNGQELFAELRGTGAGAGGRSFGRDEQISGRFPRLQQRLPIVRVDEALYGMADSLRSTLRDFIGANLHTKPAVGFLQCSVDPADLSGVMNKVLHTVEDLENLYEDLSSGQHLSVPIRAMVCNFKMPLKVFLLDMAALRDPASLSQGELHDVIGRCIDLEQEMCRLSLGFLMEDSVQSQGAAKRA